MATWRGSQAQLGGRHGARQAHRHRRRVQHGRRRRAAAAAATLALPSAATRGCCVDDAHGFGVLGAHGRGGFEHVGLEAAPPCDPDGHARQGVRHLRRVRGRRSTTLIECLMQKARTYIYTTALPPARGRGHPRQPAADARRAAGGARARCAARPRSSAPAPAASGCALLESFTPIQPVMLGDDASGASPPAPLLERARPAGAGDPPADRAARAASRLRITLSALHSEPQVERLLDALAALARTAASP
ncbi:MAG: hypothetical protein MZV65_20475 [Chromatiales bacterium]|nr:hypothetical protein [Chromatiales bacterium]